MGKGLWVGEKVQMSFSEGFMAAMKVDLKRW